MSLVFNDTDTLRGLVQIYEKEAGLPRGTVSGDATKLKEFAADANLALDDFTALALQAGGTWQFDDSNHDDYPIITTNLVAGRRDYAFTTDEQGNIILDIFKVLVADASGVFREITPVDVQSQADTTGFTNGQEATGAPSRYDKTANGIFLDLVPNYSRTGGLKGYINREASYFTADDNTKKPGVPGIFHRYFAVKPAHDYARRKRLANKDDLLSEVLRLEADAIEYFGARSRDEKKRLTVGYQNNK